MIRSASRKVLPWAVLVLVTAACGPSIALFSERAYNQATMLKVKSLALMDQATESYADHSEDAEELRIEVEAAYEYARGRPKNELSARQWEILRDPDRNLLGGFLRRWEQQGRLSEIFVTEAKGLVEDAFDQIIGLESGKIRPSDVQPIGS